MTAVAQGELFPTAIEIRPTISMDRGESFVTQCSWCGLLVCAEEKVELGDCPACSSSSARPAAYVHSWWRQDLPVGPFGSRYIDAAQSVDLRVPKEHTPAHGPSGDHPDLDLPTLVGEPEPLT